MLIIPLFYHINGMYTYFPLAKRLHDREESTFRHVELDCFADCEKYIDDVLLADIYYAVVDGEHVYWWNCWFYACDTEKDTSFWNLIRKQQEKACDYPGNRRVMYVDTASLVPEDSRHWHETVCYHAYAEHTWCARPIQVGPCGILYYNQKNKRISFWYLGRPVYKESEGWQLTGTHLSVLLRPLRRAGVALDYATPPSTYTLGEKYNNMNFDWSMLNADDEDYLTFEQAEKLKKQFIYWFN